MPRRSTKYHRLPSRSGVYIPWWPRWAISWRGSAVGLVTSVSLAHRRLCRNKSRLRAEFGTAEDGGDDAFEDPPAPVIAAHVGIVEVGNHVDLHTLWRVVIAGEGEPGGTPARPVGAVGVDHEVAQAVAGGAGAGARLERGDHSLGVMELPTNRDVVDVGGQDLAQVVVVLIVQRPGECRVEFLDREAVGVVEAGHRLVTGLARVPIPAMDTSMVPPSRVRSTFCTAPPLAEALRAVPIASTSPASSVRCRDAKEMTSATENRRLA